MIQWQSILNNFPPCPSKYWPFNVAETSVSKTTAVNLIIEKIQIKRIFLRALSKAASWIHQNC